MYKFIVLKEIFKSNQCAYQHTDEKDISFLVHIISTIIVLLI